MSGRYLVQIRGTDGGIRIEAPDQEGGWVDHLRCDERAEAMSVARRLAAAHTYGIRVRDWDRGGTVIFRHAEPPGDETRAGGTRRRH